MQLHVETWDGMASEKDGWKQSLVGWKLLPKRKPKLHLDSMTNWQVQMITDNHGGKFGMEWQAKPWDICENKVHSHICKNEVFVLRMKYLLEEIILVERQQKKKKIP